MRSANRRSAIHLGFLSLTIAVTAGAVFAQDTVPSVVVTEAAERDITPQFSYVGRIEPFERVELRARVEGFLEQRNFREGSEIAEGDVLFVIEKAPYEVVVRQREADLVGANATLENASANFERQQTLVERGTVSEATLDESRAALGTSRAQVLQAEAALESAKLDLSYTEVTSPVEGRISRARYSVGNLVGPNSEPLATVTKVDPIYVEINVSEKDLVEARRQGIDLEDPPVAPSLVLSDGSDYPHSGEFDYLDPEVSQSTDTVTARAVFPNPERLLLPGQFVTVIVKQKDPVSAIMVPQSAVQRDQVGYFVLVVDRADKVEQRRVEVGNQVGTDWVVSNGVTVGERIITQGLQKVRPEMVVNPVLGGES